MLIDTHVHLDFESFDDDLENVIQDSINVNVKNFIIPGTSFKTIEKAKYISTKYENIYFASGLHPNNVDEISNNEDLKILDINAKHPKCRAIGECGLDFFRLNLEDFCEDEHFKKTLITEKQESIFKYHIELAIKNDLPLILHIRDNAKNELATDRIIELLKEYKDIRGVFHCFNANHKLLEFNNFFYGIGGIVTFKNANKLISVLPLIKNKIILETDAPFLAPIPFRGKRNEPQFIPFILEKIANILNESKETIEKISTENAKELFNI